jgi:hypothetical protein
MNTPLGNTFNLISEVKMEHLPTAQITPMAAMSEARTDARQRLIVDAGIAVQGSSNTMSAVEYLRTRDVRTHVIERVLLEPHRRRSGS